MRICVDISPAVYRRASIGLIAPQDVQSWVDAINNLSCNPQLREELRQKGLRRVKDFSWDLAAEKTLSIYHEIYERFCRSAHRN